MSFSEFVQIMESFLKQENWVVQVFIVVFLTAFINWLQKRIIAKLINRLKKSWTNWDHALFIAGQKPVTLLIWILGLTFAADIVKEQTDAAIFGAIEPIREVGVIVIIVWFLVRFI